MLQNSQENTRARVSFNKGAGLRLWHRYFAINFEKFLRTHFIQNPSWILLLLGRLHLDMFRAFSNKYMKNTIMPIPNL